MPRSAAGRSKTRRVENENSPGRCGRLAPVHPPGATRKVGRSTTGRSSGVSLRSTYTSPVVPEGMAGDARVGPGRRLPGSAAFGATAGRPVTVPLRAGLVGEPTSVPEVGPCSSCLDQRPGAVHADPVARVLARWRLRTDGSTGAVGVPPWLRPVPRCPWPPASRQLGAPKLLLCSPPRLPGARRFGAWLHAPSGVASASWTRAVFPLPQPEGFSWKTRSSSPGWRALPGTSDTFANG